METSERWEKAVQEHGAVLAGSKKVKEGGL